MGTAAATARERRPAPESTTLPGAVLFRGVLVTLAALQAWAARHAISSDAVAYLDVGDAFLRRDWSLAVNGLWSPLFPWLLGVARTIVEPRRYNEYPFAHLFQFVVFLAALGAFEFFLRRWIGLIRAQSAEAWAALGYGFFGWASLGMIGLAPITPDLMASALFYVACGLVLDRRAFWLGAAVGLGYWARAPFFLLFVPFAVALIWMRRRHAHALRDSFLCSLGFALIAGPLFGALSHAKNRWTFSESGRLNYAWYVAGAAYRHWQGEPTGTGNEVALPLMPAEVKPTGRPMHPVRRILSDPPVFEFASPVHCTYAPWCDASYWFEGLSAPLDWERQTARLISNLRQLRSHILPLALHRLWPTEASLLVWPALMFALLVFGATRWRRSAMPRHWAVLLLPAATGLLLYACVYVEARYIAAYFVVFMITLFAGIDLRREWALWIAAAFLICALPAVTMGAQRAWRERNNAAIEWSAAKAMLDYGGLRSGDAIAVLSYGSPWHSRWARLARVRIVAEIYDGAFSQSEDRFWKAPPAMRRELLEAFRKAGAVAAISRHTPAWAQKEGWQLIPDSGMTLFPLGDRTRN